MKRMGRLPTTSTESVFNPNRTPAECIRAGIFGGCYFNPRGGKRGIMGASVAIDHREFPASWFRGLPEHMYMSRRYDPATNHYGVKCGKDQAYWESKGWIHPQDPRGWFQWYCRYAVGRRSDDDQRQINRWQGVRRRWGMHLARSIRKRYGDNPTQRQLNDPEVSPVVRQLLLHWALHMDMALFRELRSK